MPHAYAEVSTQRPERYLKQLASHLGQRCSISEETDGTRITLPPENGTAHCLLSPQTETLVLRAEADDDDGLAQIQDVIGRHLERFGEREGLAVTWKHDTGAAQ